MKYYDEQFKQRTFASIKDSREYELICNIYNSLFTKMRTILKKRKKKQNSNHELPESEYNKIRVPPCRVRLFELALRYRVVIIPTHSYNIIFLNR